MTQEEYKDLLENIEIAILPQYNAVTTTDEKLNGILSKLDIDEIYYLRMLLKGPDYGMFSYNDYIKQEKS